MAIFGFIKNGKKVKVNYFPATYPAGNVTFDNTQSGMTATDVQGAIDELNADKANKLLKVPVTVNTNSDGIGFLSMTTEHYSVYSAFTADKIVTPFIVSGSPNPYDYYWVKIEDWNHVASANASFSVDVWCNYFD